MSDVQPSTLPPTGPLEFRGVLVLDPRDPSRLLQVNLLTRLVDTPGGRQRILVTPVPFTQPHPQNRILELEVCDVTFPASTVRYLVTLEMAQDFFGDMEPLPPPSTSGEIALVRYKCYLPGCRWTSRQRQNVGNHFLQEHHPGQTFEIDRVLSFVLNGPKDPHVILSGYHAPRQTVSPSVRRSQASEEALSTETLSTAFAVPDKGTLTDSPVRRLITAQEQDMRYYDEEGEYVSEVAQKHPLGPDPRNWKLDDRSDKLVEEYLEQYPITGPVPADNEPLYCICMQPEDDRTMIECGNQERCVNQWYHLECIGMTEDEIPGEGVEWFCERCIKFGRGRAVKVPVASSTTLVTDDDTVSEYASSDSEPTPLAKRRKLARPTSIKAGSKLLTMSQPSPTVNMKPWTADLDKKFMKDPDNAKDFDLTSFQQAKSSLRSRPAPELKAINTRKANQSSTRHTASSPPRTSSLATPRTPNSRSWTSAEQDHLIAVMKECVGRGLSGEPCWEAAHPLLLARGVVRGMGAMKMEWCRGLRHRSQIDERRRKNENNLLTAIQSKESKKQARAPNAVKRGRFKGLGKHGKPKEAYDDYKKVAAALYSSDQITEEDEREQDVDMEDALPGDDLEKLARETRKDKEMQTALLLSMATEKANPGRSRAKSL